MKRIKSEEIQRTIQDHVRHRNITSHRSILADSKNINNSVIDMNLLALSDLSLIESSINDYYSFSLNSVWNPTELFDQFEKLNFFFLNEQNLIEKSHRNIILFACFVYICIDIILVEVNDCKSFIKKYSEELKKNINLDQEQELLLKSLKNFAENKDLTKSEIVNVNFDLDYEGPEEQIERIEMIKSEKIDFESEEATGSLNKKTLSDCFQKIRSQPSQITGACYFFTNDHSNEITSSSLSPNIEYLSFSTENSVINLHKLNRSLKISESKLKRQDTQALCGHSGAVFKSKFTHDSKFLISCGQDGFSYLWKIKDEPSLYPVCSYSAHTYPVWDVETFSQLNLFSTCSKDGKACLWSFDRLYPLRVYCGHQSDVNCVKFHPNGLYLATGSNDKTVRLWSVQTSEFVRLFSGHRSRIFSLAFSPDGNYLASAGEDQKIKVWDLRSGGMLKELKGHTNIVHGLKFDENSEVLCSGGLDKTVKFWDLHQKGLGLDPGRLMAKSPSNSSELIRSFSFNFDVYSIETDVQNVFYVSGARKPELTKFGTNSKNLDEEKKLNQSKTTPEQKQASQGHGKVVMNTRRRSGVTPNRPRVSNLNYDLNDDDLYERSIFFMSTFGSKPALSNFFRIIFSANFCCFSRFRFSFSRAISSASRIVTLQQTDRTMAAMIQTTTRHANEM
ncbi:TAF5-like RNA polymerase II p300 CBP-associated factor-associated factor 65 kDa subunit 5L [Brachionus plicatilis]|uniref:TAF5-like RNA polymerase II p300 CBP-associated factor-associated factor 65 kDa subunit 5L n=1 Tax=Brachionus plicatilis TaxID=10195 RepID=A0A3M7S1D7_BRAPC|nr:TAF5-like RNA polymerase II p300 CBP-associated factor-associated factor 65 kDa subunit 5L [Brachionus plicatilis]